MPLSNRSIKTFQFRRKIFHGNLRGVLLELEDCVIVLSRLKTFLTHNLVVGRMEMTHI